MKKSILFFLSLYLLLSCKKDESIYTKSSDIINISGITSRDPFGNYINSIDSTDWIKENSWPDIVNDKFNFTDTLNYSWENDSCSSLNLIAYPNPLDTNMTLQITPSSSSIMKYIVVDESAKVYSSGTLRIDAESLTFSFPDSLYSKNKLYRFYFALYNKSKKIYYRSHGDVMKN